MINRFKVKRALLCAAVTLCSSYTSLTHSQTVGTLIWEDNFNTFNTDIWNIDEGDGCDIGLCGWGNQELQWYSPNNVSIQDVPGEIGNSALVLEARSQDMNGYAFTSGKVTTQNKLSIQYGMVETRIRVPDLDQGLWPAAWMLGTSTLPWPRKGEVDMMEMGHSSGERARQGHAGVSPNNYVGSNAIFFADSACSDANPTCAASIAYDTNYNKPYVSEQAMNDRFMIYRTYWTSTQMRFTVVDDGVEYDLYEGPLALGGDTAALQAPFYLLLNLAVGGTFTDASAPGDVTAPRPGAMYIDYVRVYEIEGEGKVIQGDLTPPEDGVFGVFTETTATNGGLDAGVSSDIFVWDLSSSVGSLAPYEGENVIANSFDGANTWFGAGIVSRQARDMSLFDEGVLRFNIHIPANVSFRIGVTDTYTNEHWLTFPAGETTYGLVRDGDWGQVEIPVDDLRGTLIALQSMQYLFAISSDPSNFPSAPFQYAIDNIVWDSGNAAPMDSDGDGVHDDQDICPDTPLGEAVDSDGCAIVSGGDATVSFGRVTTSQSDRDTWSTVYFDSEFVSAPIVIMGAPSANVLHPMAVRVRNVTTTGFEFKFDEWHYLDGSHASETLSYIAAVPGTHTMGGLQISAAEVSLNNFWQSVVYETGFSSAPLVFAQQVTDNDTAPTTTRLRNVSRLGFQLKLQEEEVADQSHAYEAVHYIAIELGEGSLLGQDIKAGVTSRAVTQHWFTIEFGDSYNNANFLAGMQTHHGADTSTVRYQGLLGDSVNVKIEEEQSRDNEIAHTTEVVGWLVIGDKDTPIPADSDNDGVTDEFDACPDSIAGVAVDDSGCEVIISELFGAQSSGAQSVAFFVNTTAWADIHYIINGQSQLNIRMTQTGTRNEFTASGINTGDIVEYFVTYWDEEGGYALDTEMRVYIHE